MPKLDFKKQFSSLYAPGIKLVQMVNVPEMNFVMIDGTGDPNGAAYHEALETLYPIAYTLKFMVNKETGVDYGVMPLEGLWWAEDMTDFLKQNRNKWQWTSMIMQPEPVTEQFFRAAVKKLKGSKNPPVLDKARFEAFKEGISAQIMYIGPYSQEGPTILRIHHFIREKGYKLSGKHHEIYLGDPRRSQPEKLKTVIRQPMEKA